MTTVRFYALVMAAIFCCGIAYIFYGNASTKDLETLANSAESLQDEKLNQAIREALSDGHITNAEFSKLNIMAKNIEFDMRRELAESRIKIITDASK